MTDAVPRRPRTRVIGDPEVERRTPTGTGWLVAVGVVVMVAHNVLVVRGIGEAATVVVNAGFAGGLVVAARRCGFGRRELGLDRGHQRWPIVVASAAVAVALAGTAGALGLVPSDASVGSLDAAQVAFRLLLAIPIGTALCEELIFRGVLLASLDRRLGRRWSTLAVSVLFGLWHVAAEAARTDGWTPAIASGVIATALISALVLCPLRRLSGGLAAPVAVHAATNMTVFALVVAMS